MSLSALLREQTARAWGTLACHPRGWVGVDLGTRTWKFAQVERRNGGFQIADRWLIDTAPQPLLTSTALAEGFLASRRADLAAARKLFAGRASAAALSMSLTDLRSFEIPGGPLAEMRDMVREELAADSEMEPIDRSFDFWITQEDPDGIARVSAVAVPTPVTVRVADDLQAAGFECQALDGVPCALARAIAMVEGESDVPVAALDLGYSSSTFVIATQGRPQFTRVLRGAELQSLLNPLQESLQLSNDQCTQWLVRYGVSAGNGPRSSSMGGAMQLLANPLSHLVEELTRTLSFVAQHARSLVPARMVLLGGGASTRNLPAFLSEQLNLPVRPWQLSPGTDEATSDEALFGIAAALSVIAWENHACT